jgi:hypothetical protein
MTHHSILSKSRQGCWEPNTFGLQSGNRDTGARPVPSPLAHLYRGVLPKFSAPNLSGEKLPQKEYYRPILETLYELGGRGTIAQVLSGVEAKLKPRFRDVDWQRLSSGDVRWQNTAQWARYHLVKQGLLRRDSQRGVWELTDAGVKVVEGERAQGTPNS